MKPLDSERESHRKVRGDEAIGLQLGTARYGLAEVEPLVDGERELPLVAEARLRAFGERRGGQRPYTFGDRGRSRRLSVLCERGGGREEESERTAGMGSAEARLRRHGAQP